MLYPLSYGSKATSHLRVTWLRLARIVRPEPRRLPPRSA